MTVASEKIIEILSVDSLLIWGFRFCCFCVGVAMLPEVQSDPEDGGKIYLRKERNNTPDLMK
jgi:hypothetical protein